MKPDMKGRMVSRADMITKDILRDSDKVSEILFSKMKRFQPAVAELELYEFKYGIKEFVPEMRMGFCNPSNLQQPLKPR